MRSSFGQEVHSLGIALDNKTGNAMTKWLTKETRSSWTIACLAG
jgi:hypothetical protein